MVKSKIIIVMTAYNVGHVLNKTVAELPPGCWDEIILVDDRSTDNTAEVARKLGLTVVSHEKNTGYGGAQKTGYKAALERGADYVVLVHGDNQYDPSKVPLFIKKMRDEGCDLVTGTRMILGDALSNGMPVWKFIPNRFLTWLENTVFRSRLSDYHNGFRAYTADFLEQVPLDLMSDKFDFDTDIIIQGVMRGCKIGEVPHPTRYDQENSQMSFGKGIVYGLSILRTVVRYGLHRAGIVKQKVYEINKRREYEPV